MYTFAIVLSLALLASASFEDDRKMDEYLRMLPNVAEPGETLESLINVEAAETGEIGLVSFGVGKAVEETFISPADGRPNLNLVDASGNIVLHMNIRHDYNSFVLNSKINGNWGREERPSGYDFTTGVRKCIQVKAEANVYVIYVNGIEFHRYASRAAASTIIAAQFAWGGSDTNQAQLLKLTYIFRLAA